MLSTVRSVEVVSDPTNVLALEAAARRQHQADAGTPCSLSPGTTNQRFEAPGALAHFELFTLLSSAPDTGSGRTEAELQVLHLEFWAEMAELLDAGTTRIEFTIIGDGPMRDRVEDTVGPGLPGVALHDAPQRTQGIGYYNLQPSRSSRRAGRGTSSSETVASLTGRPH